MLQAIKYAKSKHSKSVFEASIKFNVPYSTLKHRVKGRVSRQQSRQPLQKLLPASETELLRWITELTIIGYSPSHMVVKEMVEIIRARQEGFDSEVPIITPLGKNWVPNFI